MLSGRDYYKNGAPNPNKPVSEEKCIKYLQQFGYVEPEPGKLSSARGIVGDLLEDVLKLAIKKFQEFAGLPETGVLDTETKEKMTIPRCGMLDVQNIGGVVKWNKSHLTYHIVNYSPDLPQQEQSEAIQRAFALWSEQVPLDFSETTDISSADIKIEFASGVHGDPWPFDGRGGVLAHATFPTSGMLHFDESENWVYMDAAKIAISHYTDLYAVAIHEIGHILGLEHSKVETAIMAPFYQKTVDSSGRYVMPTLQPDDIRAIKAIYGSRGGGRRPDSPSWLDSGSRTLPGFDDNGGSWFGGGIGFERSGTRDRWGTDDWPSLNRH